MKKAFLKVLSVVLVVVLTLTSAPLSGFVGIDLPDFLLFSAKAEETESIDDKTSQISDETTVINDEYVYYTDLFFGYPYYLNNKIEDNYSDMIIEQYSSVLNSYSGFDTFLAALKTGNAEGLSIYIKEIGSALGLTDSYYDECIDKATIELMKMVFSDKEYMMKAAKSTTKGIKHLSTFVTTGQVTTSLIAQYMTTLSSTQVETISNTLKDNVDDVLDIASDSAKVMEIIVTACFMEDIKLDVINTLITLLDENSILKQGLVSLKNDITTNMAKYILQEYITSKGISELYDWLTKNLIWEQISNNLINIGTVAKMLGSLIVDASFWVFFDLIYPVGSGEEVIVTTILSTYVTDLYTSITSQKLKFYDVFYTSDIADYETLYNTYISAIKTTLKYSKKLAKNSTQEDMLDNAYNSVCDSYTYENYIRLCRNSVINTSYNNRLKRNVSSDLLMTTTNDFSIGIPSEEIDLENAIYLFEGRIVHGLKIYYDYTFQNDCEIDGDICIWGGYRKATIPENITVIVNGNVYASAGHTTEY
ncbi:MAG: hypothetical protein IJZ16_00615, partial [Clostridia bacterium]|nr:hypothetical protein [Clostridia bacterium]